MKSVKTFLWATVASSVVAGCCTPPAADDACNLVRIDQCGYLPASAKQAFLLTDSARFAVENAQTHRVVYRGEASPARYWAESGDSIRIADFSGLSEPGQYRIVVADSIYSHPFRISADVYADAAMAAARAFYFNRSGMAIDSVWGGPWARPAGHPDTCVLIHSSAASEARPEGTVVSSPGGWYDAGDYNKYIVNSGISTYTLLYTLSTLADYSDSQNLNIPESADSLPDLLNEALYNLNWMLTMQDPTAGGVYHKLTTLAFEGFVMPHKAVNQRYLVTKSTAADLDFAATAAYASRLLVRYGLTDLSATCATAAASAYRHALAEPGNIFRNPADVSTGEYGDDTLTDEWFWASVEMYLLTGDGGYLSNIEMDKVDFGVPSWSSVAALGLLSLTEDTTVAMPDFDALGRLRSLADNLVAAQEASPARLGLAKFEWGSNSFIANESMLKMAAFRATADERYLAATLDDVHYLLGRNATGYCYETGIGSRPSMNIHHRPSAADGVDRPVPGFLVGGPNLDVPNDCNDAASRSQYPAAAYADELCSYSTNEIAINWNAPLVNVLWSICATVR